VKRLIAAWILVVMAGCNSNPAMDAAGEQPVAQQNARDQATLRAKDHTRLGMAYFSQGRLSVALDEARTAMAADSSYPLAYNLMGVVQMALGDNSLAADYFGKALALAPSDPEINNNYGWFLCRTGRQQQSYSYFESAAGNPLYAIPTKPLTNAGICAMGANDDARAAGYFERALSADAANADAHSLLAGIYYRQNRYEEAMQQLGQLEKLTDLGAQSVWLAIRAERKLGDREAEARYISILRRKFKDSPEYQKYVRGQDE
jgi:type IV pilus assembly protein PilF